MTGPTSTASTSVTTIAESEFESTPSAPHLASLALSLAAVRVTLPLSAGDENQPITDTTVLLEACIRGAEKEPSNHDLAFPAPHPPENYSAAHERQLKPTAWS